MRSFDNPFERPLHSFMVFAKKELFCADMKKSMESMKFTFFFFEYGIVVPLLKQGLSLGCYHEVRKEAFEECP